MCSYTWLYTTTVNIYHLVDVFLDSGGSYHNDVLYTSTLAYGFPVVFNLLKRRFSIKCCCYSPSYRILFCAFHVSGFLKLFLPLFLILQNTHSKPAYYWTYRTDNSICMQRNTISSNNDSGKIITSNCVNCVIVPYLQTNL